MKKKKTRAALFRRILAQSRRAHVVVFQNARADALDLHNQAARGVGTRHERVRLHPIGRMIVPLFSGQKRNRRLQCVQAKIRVFGQRKFAAAQHDAVADAHIARTIAANFRHDQFQIVQFKCIVHNSFTAYRATAPDE